MADQMRMFRIDDLMPPAYGCNPRCIWNVTNFIVRELRPAPTIPVCSQECPICKEMMNDPDRLLSRPVRLHCGHTFCRSCILLWLRPLDNEEPPTGDMEEDTHDIELFLDAKIDAFKLDPLGEDPTTSETGRQGDGNSEDPQHSDDESEHRLSTISIDGEAETVGSEHNQPNDGYMPTFALGNNECPLCRTEVFEKPCCKGSSLLLRASLRFFDAVYRMLNITRNENENNSRTVFYVYLGQTDKLSKKNYPQNLRRIAFKHAVFKMIMLIQQGMTYYRSLENDRLYHELKRFIQGLDMSVATSPFWSDPNGMFDEDFLARGLDPLSQKKT
ncbi:MAG: hypothetical protein Q9190_005233 [Brigantiaea leucoxantha]